MTTKNKKNNHTHRQMMEQWISKYSLNMWDEFSITEFCENDLFDLKKLSVLQLSKPYIIAIVDNNDDFIRYESWNDSHPIEYINIIRITQEYSKN